MVEVFSVPEGTNGRSKKKVIPANMHSLLHRKQELVACTAAHYQQLEYRACEHEAGKVIHRIIEIGWGGAR